MRLRQLWMVFFIIILAAACGLPAQEAEQAANVPVEHELDVQRSSQVRSDAAHDVYLQGQLDQYLTALHQREVRLEAQRKARKRQVYSGQRADRHVAPSRGAAYGPWADLINQYPWPTATAYRIMMCESGGNANAYNPRSGATGLFQILNGPFDPAANVALAYRMWQKRGWQPWVCA